MISYWAKQKPWIHTDNFYKNFKGIRTENQLIHVKKKELGNHHFAASSVITDLCKKSVYTKTLGLRLLRTGYSQSQRITHRLCIKREESTFTIKNIQKWSNRVSIFMLPKMGLIDIIWILIWGIGDTIPM